MEMRKKAGMNVLESFRNIYSLTYNYNFDIFSRPVAMSLRFAAVYVANNARGDASAPSYLGGRLRWDGVEPDL